MADQKKLPMVSVVVLNWNGKRFIDPFITSFARLNYPKDKLELLFTDNGSTDGSVEYIQSNYGDMTGLKVVLNGGNFGYSKGNNLGIKHATGDYVLISNNDLELDQNLVMELVAVAEDKQAAITVPKLMYLNKPGIINNAGSILDTASDWPVYEIGINEKDTGQYDSIREITAFCGACALVRRDFLQTVGLFDNKFFMYFEDGDLSWRGQAAGHHFYYAPKAIANHVHTGSSKEGSPLFNHFVGRNRLLVLAKNARWRFLAKAWAKTLRDHLLVRLKNVARSFVGKYGKRAALKEFWFSQKMIWAAAILTPYALLKRYKIIKEDRLS